jgi:hypothetical protein
MMSKMFAATILCSSDGVLAQTIFRQTDAAGHTTFTDRPPAGMVVPHATFRGEERGSVPPPRIAKGTRPDLAKALFSNSAMTSMYAATVDYNEAARRLRQARQSSQEGMESRPGEQGDAGATAMNKRYERRQQRLERAVVAAELRSRDTALIRTAMLELERAVKIGSLKLAQP